LPGRGERFGKRQRLAILILRQLRLGGRAPGGLAEHRRHPAAVERQLDLQYFSHHTVVAGDGSRKHRARLCRRKLEFGQLRARAYLWVRRRAKRFAYPRYQRAKRGRSFLRRFRQTAAERAAHPAELFVLALKERNETPHLSVARYTDEEDAGYRQTLRTALDLAVRHIEDERRGENGRRNGIAAIDAWIAAFEAEAAHPFFTRYKLLWITSARQYLFPLRAVGHHALHGDSGYGASAAHAEGGGSLSCELPGVGRPARIVPVPAQCRYGRPCVES